MLQSQDTVILKMVIAILEESLGNTIKKSFMKKD